MVSVGDKPGRHGVVQMAFLAHDTVLEHLRILSAHKHLTVIVTLNHQVVGAAHVVGGALGDDAHVGSDDKALALILDAEAHALDVVHRLKRRDLHVEDTERYFLKNGHMVVLDAA